MSNSVLSGSGDADEDGAVVLRQEHPAEMFSQVVSALKNSYVRHMYVHAHWKNTWK